MSERGIDSELRAENIDLVKSLPPKSLEYLADKQDFDDGFEVNSDNKMLAKQLVSKLIEGVVRNR